MKHIIADFLSKQKESSLLKIKEMRVVCNIAFDKDLIDTNSGNISYGLGKDMLITKTGASLMNLKYEDFTVASVSAGNVQLNYHPASSELAIHRFILKSFPESCVFHAHPSSAIALSLLDNILSNKKDSKLLIEELKEENKDNNNLDDFMNKSLILKYPDIKIIIPLDIETAYFFPYIYVFPLGFINDIKSLNENKLNFSAKDIFKEQGIFMIKSHGSFAWGKTPIEALRWTMMLEAASKIILKIVDL